MVIPVFNQVGHLRACLACIEPAYGMEILVVDNGSDRGSQAGQLAREYPGVVFLEQAKPGSYAARNEGVRVSKGSILAFLDADCRPRQGWADAGRKYFDSHDDRLVAGAVLPLLPPQPTLVERFDARFGVPQVALVTRTGTATTANLWMRRDLWEQHGGFREDLLSGADLDFCRRAGAPVYVPAIAVGHVVRDSLAAWRIKSRRMAAPDWERRGIAGLFYDLLPPVKLASTEGISLAGLMWLTRLWTAEEKVRLWLGGAAERR